MIGTDRHRNAIAPERNIDDDKKKIIFIFANVLHLKDLKTI